MKKEYKLGKRKLEIEIRRNIKKNFYKVSWGLVL